MFVGDGVVAGEQVRLAPSDQVAARIANVRDCNAIVAQSAGHDRGRHEIPPDLAAWPASTTRVFAFRTRFVNSEGCGSPGVALRKPSSTLSTAVWEATSPRSCPPTPSASAKSQPCVAHVLRRRGGSVPEIIFVSLANSPDVGKFRELDIHRSVLDRAEGGSQTAHNCRRCRLKASVH